MMATPVIIQICITRP